VPVSNLADLCQVFNLLVLKSRLDETNWILFMEINQDAYQNNFKGYVCYQNSIWFRQLS